MDTRLAFVSVPPVRADVVVIGGGIAGLAVSFFAHRAGLSCVVLERRPALASLSTGAATGAFRLQFDNPEELALARESVAFFARFADETGLAHWDIGLRAQGYLWCATDASTCSMQCVLVDRQRSWGLDDVELLNGEDARRRFPYLAPEVRQARYRAGDGWLDAKRLAIGFALAGGAALSLSTTVLGIRTDHGRAIGVRTSRGDVDAGAVVIAAGPFASEVGRTAGLPLPIAPVRRQRLVLPDVPEVPADAPMTIDEETGAHWRPAGGGAHGMWVQHGMPPGPAVDDVAASDHFAFALLDPASPHALARISPLWRSVWSRQSLHWTVRAGQYDDTPDRRPLLGATPVEGVYLNTGYSGHGVMLSPAGARRVVDSITGALAPEDNPFRLQRAFEPAHAGAL